MLIWPPAAENNQKIVYYNFYLGEHVHTEWDRKLIFDMDIGSDLYFHIMKKIGRVVARWTPKGLGGDNHPNIGENLFGRVTHQSKAHEQTS